VPQELVTPRSADKPGRVTLETGAATRHNAISSAPRPEALDGNRQELELIMSLTQQIAAAVLEGDDVRTRQLVQEALASNLPSQQVLREGLLAGMGEVGRRFREGEYYLPEVLVAADAMKVGIEVLRPRLIAEDVRPEATAIIGTVEGDLHDIGKNLVATMLQGAGFEVIDLGVDVSADKFVAACRERPVDVLALSALLTTTMPQMEAVVKRVRESLKPGPKIIIGGAPVTEKYAQQIGADGYGRDAATGADVAKKLVSRKAS
jgi:5-methyltetrahydrofolate--homocysteine methyltransferase